MVRITSLCATHGLCIRDKTSVKRYSLILVHIIFAWRPKVHTGKDDEERAIFPVLGGVSVLTWSGDGGITEKTQRYGEILADRYVYGE